MYNIINKTRLPRITSSPLNLNMEPTQSNLPTVSNKLTGCEANFKFNLEGLDLTLS